MCASAHIHVGTTYSASALGARRHQIPLELQAAVHHSTCVRRPELRSSVRVECALTEPPLELWL